MKKFYSQNSLPFLQAQILEKVYCDVASNKKTCMGDIAALTDYKENSRILMNAIQTLQDKKFINGDIVNGFSIPNDRLEFFQYVITRLDITKKHYSDELKLFPNAYPSGLERFAENQKVEDINRYGFVHRWYDYLEDFPYQLIEDKIKEYKLGKKSLIVDPFCGSGTTLISANLFKCNSVGFDVNPLMTFVSMVKTTFDIDLDKLAQSIRKISKEFLSIIHDMKHPIPQGSFIYKMPIKELNQWLSPVLQREVALLQESIMKIKMVNIRNLLLLAMSKSCFEASYVSLCPGTTFYPFREKPDFWKTFINKVYMMYYDIKAVQQHNSYGKTTLINDSCLNSSKYLKKNSIDFIITSPPYPNDLEYTRQTRLELYLLDFVNNMDDVQKIKRKMTKGSTKLIFKESDSEKFIASDNTIRSISDAIYEMTKDKNWGFDYPRMIREYFGDMYLCLREYYMLMKEGSHFLLVVGDQTIKGVFVPVCDILIKLAYEIGYKNCRKELFRIRRSTGHDIPLPEEIIILEK